MPRRPLTWLATVLLLAPLTACGSNGAATEGETTPCTYPTSGEPAVPVDVPPEAAPAEGRVPVTLGTGVGELRLSLDAAASPCTVNSFASLAAQDYFDGTTCHRLTTQGIFVLQCGDPTATGSGGPGYSFPDEVTDDATYEAGTVAMANAGPDTNGSQFFLVYEESQLPPLYTVFGSVDDESLDLLREVAGAGTSSGAPDGAPKTEVLIEDVTVG